MSVSASLADLGAIAVQRTQPAPKAWADRSVAGEDASFGRMLRDAAKEPHEKPVRDAERHAGFQRQTEIDSGKGPAEDRREHAAASTAQWAERRRAEVGHRSEPHGRTEHGRTEHGRTDHSHADGPGETEEAGKQTAATTDVSTERVDPAESPAILDTPACEKPPSEPPPAALTQAAPTAVTPATQIAEAETLSLLAADPAQPPAANGTPGAAVATGEAQATQPAPATPPAATPATPAALAAAAQLLAETAPIATGGQKGVSSAAEGTTAVTTVSAKPGSITAQNGLPLVATPPSAVGQADGAAVAETSTETVAADLSKQAATQTGEAAKTLANAGEATGIEKANASSSGQQVATQASAAAAAATGSVDIARSTGADGQPQANANPTQGIQQAASTAPASDARLPQLGQAPHRHEMPVPMQAVAIEIGMRAMRGAKEFAIRLDPEDLGRIDVKLEVSEAGQVQAKVVVEKVETLQLLQRDARTLERAFDQAGLKTSPDGLQFSLRDPGGQGRSNDEQTPRNSSSGSHKAEEPVIDEIRLQTIQYRIAGNGGLDIRI